MTQMQKTLRKITKLNLAIYKKNITLRPTVIKLGLQAWLNI